METDTDWGAWSREAVQLMQRRNDAFVVRFGLEGAHYHWDLDEACLAFPSSSGELVADLCVLGTLSESAGTFLWAWANPEIHARARVGLEKVRAFGLAHHLDLLTVGEWTGAGPEALEIASVASRILDAEGLWIAPTGDVTLYFALSNFRRTSKV